MAPQAVHWPGIYQYTRVRAPVAEASLAICSPHLHHAIHGAQGVLPCAGWGDGQSIESTVFDAIVRI